MSELSQHCLIVRSQLPRGPRAAGLLADAHALGLTRVTHLEIQELFFIEGDLCPDDQHRLAAELLSDPIAQAYEWRGAQDDTDGERLNISSRARELVSVTVSELVKAWQHLTPVLSPDSKQHRIRREDKARRKS